MRQIVNSEYRELFTTKARYTILMGGRGAGRSTVASQYAAAKLCAPEYFRCAIMRYVLGDIRNSIYREITDRFDEAGETNKIRINETLMSLEYGVNTINAVGFKKSSGDQKAKLKSLANYTTVIIEEADEIPEADFMQLDDSLRTMKGDIHIIMMLNPPPKSHWIIKRWFDLTPGPVKDFYVPVLKPEMTNTLFIRTSFEDNLANISEQSIANYRNYEKTKPDHYWNMIAGLVPEVVKGKIYSGWREVDDIPFEARLEGYGVDFGYSNDPTAIVAVYYHDGGYILDEICFQTELSNRQIADILLACPKGLVIADSAEPKSIAEIRGYGVTILPAQKGPGSLLQGIQYVKAAKISYTSQSVNIKEEYENYAWLVDKNDIGITLNEPKPGYDHSMDAIRYRIAAIKNPNRVSAHTHVPTNTLPRNNINPVQPMIQTVQGLPPELKDNPPRHAHTFTPRL